MILESVVFPRRGSLSMGLERGLGMGLLASTFDVESVVFPRRGGGRGRRHLFLLLLSRHLAQAATTNPMGLASNSGQGTTPSVFFCYWIGTLPRPPPPIPWDWLATPDKVQRPAQGGTRRGGSGGRRIRWLMKKMERQLPGRHHQSHGIG